MTPLRLREFKYPFSHTGLARKDSTGIIRNGLGQCVTWSGDDDLSNLRLPGGRGERVGGEVRWR
jgi:hypothetical protein